MENSSSLKLEEDYFSYYILRLNKENFDYIMSKILNNNLFITTSKQDYKIGDYVFFNKNFKIKHIVKPFESIDDIAKKYKKDKNEILNKNNIKNIFVGQQLDI